MCKAVFNTLYFRKMFGLYCLVVDYRTIMKTARAIDVVFALVSDGGLTTTLVTITACIRTLPKILQLELQHTLQHVLENLKI